LFLLLTKYLPYWEGVAPFRSAYKCEIVYVGHSKKKMIEWLDRILPRLGRKVLGCWCKQLSQIQKRQWQWPWPTDASSILEEAAYLKYWAPPNRVLMANIRMSDDWGTIETWLFYTWWLLVSASTNTIYTRRVDKATENVFSQQQHVTLSFDLTDFEIWPRDLYCVAASLAVAIIVRNFPRNWIHEKVATYSIDLLTFLSSSSAAISHHHKHWGREEKYMNRKWFFFHFITKISKFSFRSAIEITQSSYS